MLALLLLVLAAAASVVRAQDRPQPIVNGEDQLAPVPYMATLWLTTYLEQGQVANPCGAVFIDPWWVLTAGHCFARNVDPFLPDPQQQIPVPKVFNVNNVQPGKVFVGGVDRFNDAEFVIREFADIIVHPLYWANNGSNDPTNPYDLTLILMKEPIFELKPIQINRNRRLPRLGETLRAYGWGYIANLIPNQQPNQATILQVTSTNVTACDVAVPGVPVPATDFCTLGKNPSDLQTNVCRGDSGGPFVQSDANGQDCLVGITSFSLSTCADVDFIADPLVGGAVGVANFAPWIDGVIRGYAKDFQIFPQPVFPTNRAQSIEFNGERQVFHADTVTMSFYPATVTTKYGNGPYYFKLLVDGGAVLSWDSDNTDPQVVDITMPMGTTELVIVARESRKGYTSKVSATVVVKPRGCSAWHCSCSHLSKWGPAHWSPAAYAYSSAHCSPAHSSYGSSYGAYY